MKKHLQYLLFYIILIFIFSDCASIGSPGGGPADTQPPYLLEENILPINRTNILKNQKIILPFNERISPPTVVNALRIEPETNIAPDAAIPSIPSMKLYAFMIQTKSNNVISIPIRDGSQSILTSGPPLNQKSTQQLSKNWTTSLYFTPI